jgi:putative ABC transport system ATP-binding protein
MLRLESIKKSYRLGEALVPALRGVSLEIEAGEAVALIGKSGSGKSSLLHVAGLIDRPDEGKVLYDDEDLLSLSDDARSDFRRDKFGFIFQSYHLVPVLSVLENVLLPVSLKGKIGKPERARAKELLDAVELKDFATRNVKALSGGQRQRVAIARALINSPSVVFADEPTANLDAASGTKVVDLLFGLCKKSKVSLLFATHDMSLATEANRRFPMKDGQQEKK